jgi:hypothetical protein
MSEVIFADGRARETPKIAKSKQYPVLGKVAYLTVKLGRLGKAKTACIASTPLQSE